MYDNLLTGLRRLVDRKLIEHNLKYGENRKVAGTRIRDFWENAAKGTDPTMANGTYQGIEEKEEITPFPEEVVCKEHDSVSCLCWL